jgi:exodeoxyribonuclease VII small subunit
LRLEWLLAAWNGMKELEVSTRIDPTQDNGTSQTFEQALAELEAVVRILEDGQIGLDESLAKYEDGVRLLKACRESLQNAERKIMLLTGLDANGNPVIEPFSEEAATLEEKRDSRTRRRSRGTTAPTSSCEELPENAEGLENNTESNRQRGLF